MSIDLDRIVIEPEKTCALIVGMDEYPNLAGESLDNAVREAIEFAKWLLDLGVAANRIKLFLSGGEQPPQLFDNRNCSLVPQRPNTDDIRAAFKKPFATDEPDNLLFVYWAGHGCTAPDLDRHQLLFELNYSEENDRKVFDLEYLKQALRAEDWEHFPRQILLVNACADYARGDKFDRQEFNDLSSLDHELYRKQFTLCAASPGQSAYDQSPLPLIGTLKKTVNRQRQLNLHEFCDRICEAAELLGQIPRIDWQHGNGSRGGYSSDELVRLIYCKLAQCDLNFKHDLKPLYQKYFEDAEDVGSIWEIISHLEADFSRFQVEKGQQMAGVCWPVIEFALHVICKHEGDGVIKQLDQELTLFFKQKAGQGTRYEVPALTTKRDRIKEIHRQPVGPLYLSIIPEETGDKFQFYSHDSTGERIFNEEIRIAAGETFETAFQQAILKREAKLKGFDLHFHFFLRIENFNLSLHEWFDPTLPSEDEERLEENHCVAVRCWERATGTGLGWGFASDHWQRKARTLKTRQFQVPPRINWIAEPDMCDWKEVAENYEYPGFDRLPLSKWLRSAMLKGLPFLVWPRQASEKWEDCRKKIDAIELNGDWQNRFPRIRRQHRDAPFAVLWDDPDHNPYAEERNALPPFSDIA